MKKCTACDKYKEYSNFSLSKSTKDGFQYICKPCSAKKLREWRLNNPSESTIKTIKKRELLSNGKKICTKCNGEKELSEFYKKNNSKDNLTSNCKSCINKYQLKTRERKREKKRKLKDENKHIAETERKRKQKTYYINNKEKYRKRYQKNKAKLNQRSVDRHKERYQSDKLYRLKSTLRSRTSNAFKKSRWNKNSSNESMLSCTFKEAFMYIESKFKKGMSWDNYGDWHVDHIIPLASAKNESELKILCNYRNLQPLWAHENLSKSDKYKDIDKINMIEYIKKVSHSLKK